MGYFKRTIRRSRCAAEVRAALERSAALQAWAWELLAPGEPRPSGQFFRLATTEIDPRSNQPRGVLRAAGLLAARFDLPASERQRLRELFDWFNDHLARPRRVTPGMIFWFRPDAGECASRIWELVHVLREHDVLVQTMRTRRPGYIEYSDDLQVGAVPYVNRAFRIRPI